MIKKFYNNFEEIIGSIFLVAICLVATLQVSSRYLFEHPFSWTEELATHLFVYLTFIGASLALKKNDHFAVELLLDRFPKKIREVIRLSISVLVFISAAVVLWYGCRMVSRGWQIKTPALEIPSAIPYAAIPLGGFLMMIRSVEIFFKEIKTLRVKGS